MLSLLEGFKMYLDTIGDPLPIGSQVAPAPTVAPVGLVTVLVDSAPQGADIEIMVASGATPQQKYLCQPENHPDTQTPRALILGARLVLKGC